MTGLTTSASPLDANKALVPIAEDDRVMTQIRAGGRHTGDRLTERWGLSDRFGLFVQMGAVQSPGPASA